MSIVYATIIDPKEYKEHGRSMLQSFKETQEEELLVGVNQRILFNEKKIFFFDMAEYPAYRKWNKAYREALEEEGLTKDQIEGLKGSKSTALINIINKTLRKNLDYVVWIDCESIFKQNLSPKIIEEICGDYAAASVINSNEPMSFFIYNFRMGGKEFAKDHAEFYTSGRFRDYNHWDTIFSFGQVNGHHTKSVTKTPIDNILSYSIAAQA